MASSKILTPHPLTARRVCTPRPGPAFGAGVGQTRWVERGVGVNILEDARHCSVLYIRKYFVFLCIFYNETFRWESHDIAPLIIYVFFRNRNFCWRLSMHLIGKGRFVKFMTYKGKKVIITSRSIGGTILNFLYTKNLVNSIKLNMFFFF
jgi:hypothetical protein